MSRPMTADVWAATLAAQWAQKIDLEPGNLWEPAVARNLLNELARLGGDASARAFIETIYKMRLGLGGLHG